MNSTISDSENSESLTGSDFSEFSDNDGGPAWQEEVSKDGELFYVEEQNGARLGLGKTSSSQENTLHGTSDSNADTARRNGRFRPIERYESPRLSSQYEDVSYVQSGSDISAHSKRLHRQRVAGLNKNNSNGRLTRSFHLHSEPVFSNLRNIHISVRAASSYGVKGSPSLLPAMVGMMSLNKRNGGQFFHSVSHDDQVIVSTILPSGPLAGSDIDLGDILLAINDVAVYQSNVEEVLNRVPHDMEIKLTFQCMKHRLHADSGDAFNRRGDDHTTESSIVQLLNPATADVSSSQLTHHVVLYLTLNINSETARGEEDILYCYPSTDNPTTRKVKSVRGIFTTLADVSKDAFKSKVLSSTLLIDEELVHCAYHHRGAEVLVVCVPVSDYPLTRLHAIVMNTVRLLDLMHGSLSKAFASENCSRLNHLFHLLFRSNAWSMTASQPNKMVNQTVPGVRSLTLDEDVSIDIDAALTELEAADFDDGFHSQGLTRRLYVIVGSCLFYKGYLLASHLPHEDLKDVSIFCESYCLLGQMRVGQLVIWRQVHPSRSQSVPDKGDYKETKGKQFYLIVGLGYSLLCILLEAGGCAAPTPGKLGPDPLYVNRARATILHLDGIDMPAVLEEFLRREEVPSITSADAMAKKPPTSLFGTSGTTKPPSGSSRPPDSATTVQASPSGKKSFFSKSNKRGSDSGPSGQSKADLPNNTSEKSLGSPGLLQRFGSRKSQGSHSSVESAGSAPKSVKSLTAGISTSDVRSAGRQAERVELKQLTAGTHNTLFHYVHLDSNSGMLLTPCKESNELDLVTFHRSVLENFHLCVLNLHEHLAVSLRRNPKSRVHEEGVLFHCKSASHADGTRKVTPQLQYWVIGRAIRTPRLSEFYVCFHDSAQQDMVDLAFRMGFGLAT